MNKNKVALICIVDKAYPPEHSFIDGMLGNVVSKTKNIDVYLLVSKGNNHSNVVRYNNMIVLPNLLSRKGLKRFINFFVVLKQLSLLTKRLRRKYSKVVVLVRNEPIYLLSAKVHKRNYDKLIYQQSFPHELNENNFLKRLIAKSILKIMNRRVDSLLAVSPLGLSRLKKHFYKDIKGDIIPLLSSLEERNLQCDKGVLEGVLNNHLNDRTLHFLYVGTHDDRRELKIVLKAVSLAYEKTNKFDVTFIGGTNIEIAKLRDIKNIKDLENKNAIHFVNKIPREKILEILSCFDVGLSLIPPIVVYKEASPTKLTEYMNAGLGVLASKGIPLQEQYVLDSEAGVLCEWNINEIAESFIKIVEVEDIGKMKENSLKYIDNKSNYEMYLSKLTNLFE